jgi:hypothetical protein
MTYKIEKVSLRTEGFRDFIEYGNLLKMVVYFNRLPRISKDEILAMTNFFVNYL